MNNDLISRNDFSDVFNSAIFNKLHNEYLNSTASQEFKDVAEFVTTDIMIIFNNLIESAPNVEWLKELKAYRELFESPEEAKQILEQHMV